MKKIITLILFAVVIQQATGQTETFDIATYTVPKDWKKAANNGVVTYTNINTTTGTFCVLAMYACSASLGDAQKDFKMEWKGLVVDPHKASADPKTETQTTADGWKVVTAAAPIKLEGLDAYAILTVFSGFKKKFSVMTTLNDQSYVNGIDSFLENIKLNKTANPPAVQATTSAAPVTNETTEQFGAMIYSTPKNWGAKKYSDGDILIPVDLHEKEVLQIWIQQPMNFSGTMEQALQKSYDETVVALKATKMNDVNGGNYSTQTAKISFRGWEYIRCSGGIHMGGGEYPPEYGLDLFVIKLNGRFERVAIIKSRNNCNLSRYYPSERLKYYYDIENFLFSLRFPDWKEPLVKPGIAKGDGITGVWQGISMSVGMPKPGAELGAEFKVKQLIFFSNGQAYFGNNFPAEGLDELNTWMKAEINRRDWGTYSFVNGKGVLKMLYAEIPLRMENGKLVVTSNKTDHGFIKTNAVDGAKFNGMYALSSKNIAGEETGKKPVIRFTEDGKFTDNGAISILYHEYNECLNAAKDPGSGTYEVKNHSVIFNYTDGRKIKIAFIGTDYDSKNQSPATILLSFNEDALKKQ
jgi:hypothetical protein